MIVQLAIAISAGLVSAAIFAFMATGTVLASPLFYIAFLPHYVVGLGWSPAYAFIAIFSALFVLLPAFGLKIAILHAVTLSVPAYIVCYLLFLQRQQPTQIVSEEAESGSAAAAAGIAEWFPFGNVIITIALMGGVLAAISIFMVGSTYESYLAAISDMITQAFRTPEGTDNPNINQNFLNSLKEILPSVLPAASATLWMSTNLINLWLAGRITKHTQLLRRPWPDIAKIEYPKSLLILFVISLAASFLPGLPGLAASGFVGAITTAYLIMGLFVLHVLSRKSSLRNLLLIAAYLSLILIPWMSIIVTIVGVGEPLFRLRDR